jgi:tRNA(Met) cytidine acetyltransferase
MTFSIQILDRIRELHLLAKQGFNRHMLVLSGSESWCFSLVKEYLTLEYCKSSILISDQNLISGISAQSQNKLSLLLGSEYETLIWDGFSGINPDAFGIASGLLKGSGLFFLLLPELESFQASPDPDYIRMCSDNESVKSCHTFFLQRLVNHLKNSNDISIIEQGKALNELDYQATKIPNKTIQLPTADQLNAVEAIKKVSYGHRHRPLVIKANRGRGKSSALGIAAAQIYTETKQKMVITAPSKKTCESAFKHYKNEIEQHFSSQNDIENALKAFQFIPIDSLVNELTSCHLLFIDEAAAIPNSILTVLLKHYARIIYATTIHGYEGNGQGFAIRFQKILSSVRPQWNSILLSTPIRWQQDDPLERWFFNFLLLNSELLEINDSSAPIVKLAPEKTTSLQSRTRLVDQADLYQNEALLNQIVSLLVIAHYQTSPSDIRLILDHHKVSIFVTELVHDENIDDANDDYHLSITVLGVCLVIEEGGLKSDELAESIISGQRRPRGQLFPQALCASSANADFLKQTCFRVMRIAVHPQYQQKGIGSSLLNSLYELAKLNTIDSISTSYGLSSELLSFWNKNSFNVVKLGSKVDGSSGLQSIMMMRAISKSASQFLCQYEQEYLASFIFKLNRTHQTLAAELVSAIMQSFSHLELNRLPINRVKIHAFANSLRPYEESDLDIFDYVISRIMTKHWDKLDSKFQAILVIKILQNRNDEFCLKHLDLKGKKQLNKDLRAAVKALLDTEA